MLIKYNISFRSRLREHLTTLKCYILNLNLYFICIFVIRKHTF